YSRSSPVLSSFPTRRSSDLLGLGIGYLTLRLKGVFFSIATFALSVVLQTLIINWDYVGGAKGYTLIRPPAPFFGSWAILLFMVIDWKSTRLNSSHVSISYAV